MTSRCRGALEWSGRGGLSRLRCRRRGSLGRLLRLLGPTPLTTTLGPSGTVLARCGLQSATPAVDPALAMGGALALASAFRPSLMLRLVPLTLALTLLATGVDGVAPLILSPGVSAIRAGRVSYTSGPIPRATAAGRGATLGSKGGRKTHGQGQQYCAA